MALPTGIFVSVRNVYIQAVGWPVAVTVFCRCQEVRMMGGKIAGVIYYAAAVSLGH